MPPGLAGSVPPRTKVWATAARRRAPSWGRPSDLTRSRPVNRALPALLVTPASLAVAVASVAAWWWLLREPPDGGYLDGLPHVAPSKGVRPHEPPHTQPK